MRRARVGGVVVGGLLAALVLPSRVIAQENAASPAALVVPEGVVVNAKIGEKLDEFLTRLEAFGFSGAVAYAKKDKVFLLKAYGYADRESHRKNTVDTLFDIASVSKQFTAAGILKLQMEGKVATDDPMSKYFAKTPEDEAGICLYHLLSHTSGLPSDIEATSETVERGELIDLIRGATMRGEPGTKFEYNNVGYCALGAVIEIASGEKYETFMRRRIFGPAGMTDVAFLGETLPRGVRSATGHTGPWEMWPAEEGWYSWGLRACGGIMCSVRDLLKWEVALRSDTVLDANSKLELFNAVTPGYAYGWFVTKGEDKRMTYWHGGNTRGFECHFERRPADQMVFILLTNDTEKSRIIADALRTVIDGKSVEMPPKPEPMTNEQLAKYAGTYELPGGGTFKIDVDDGALVVRDYGLVAMTERLRDRSPEEIQRTKKVDKLTQEAMKAWSEGDMEGLRDVFGDRREWADKVSQRWAVLVNAGGGLTSVKTLGSLDRTKGETSTYIVIESKERKDVIKLLWHDGQVFGEDLAYPAEMRFVPTGPADFLSYEITSEPTPRDRAMRVVMDEAGEPSEVAIMMDFARLFAKKRK